MLNIDANFHWLVGLLEGEGSFSIHSKSRCPRLDCGSTDFNVVERVAKTLGTKIYGPYKTANGKKPYYRIFLHGEKAIELMQQLYPFMSQRRKARIAEIFELWENTPDMRTRNSKGQYEAYPSTQQEITQ